MFKFLWIEEFLVECDFIIFDVEQVVIVLVIGVVGGYDVDYVFEFDINGLWIGYGIEDNFVGEGGGFGNFGLICIVSDQIIFFDYFVSLVIRYVGYVLDCIICLDVVYFCYIFVFKICQEIEYCLVCLLMLYVRCRVGSCCFNGWIKNIM